MSYTSYTDTIKYYALVALLLLGVSRSKAADAGAGVGAGAGAVSAKPVQVKFNVQNFTRYLLTINVENLVSLRRWMKERCKVGSTKYLMNQNIDPDGFFASDFINLKDGHAF